MSYSLMIANGDLSFNGASLNVVEGSEKLIQDLACCVLEPMGTDNAHPAFGSLIDGGTDADGNVNTGIIGTPNDGYAESFVSAEIIRICNAYQAQQQARYSEDIQTYGTATITASEALMSVGNIESIQYEDSLQLAATLVTGAGDLSINLPITTTA